MAVSGLDIYKHLPKTNCKKCGFPTCLAFAMQLAAGKVELEKCPDVTEEAKAALSEAAAPPILPVVIGSGDKALKIGEETVFFRHEKRFEHKPGMAVLITDEMSDDEVTSRINQLNTMSFERVGLQLHPDLAFLRNSSGDVGKFTALVNKVKNATEYGVILASENIDALAEGAKLLSGKNPLLYTNTGVDMEKLASIAKENTASIGLKGDGLENLAESTQKLAASGIKSIVLDPGSRAIKQAFQDQISLRRLAIKKKFRELGYPTIALPCEMTDDPMKEALYAAIFISKYAGIIVMSDLDPARIFPLLVLRLNIYTDPQRPMTMKQGIYPINNPIEDSPVCVTTNFALTYFIVSGEIERSKVPTWLCVMDTEGYSVLTGWSAGKFVADAIAPFLKKCGITDKVKHHEVIIPGYVAHMSGELEEELGEEWTVTIGCREGADIPAFLRKKVSAD